MVVTKVRLNRANIGKFLKSQDVRRDLLARGSAIRSGLPIGDGEEWKLDTFNTDRANVTVYTGNPEAMRTNAETFALLRNLDRGR